jgi:hypothetical protein
VALSIVAVAVCDWQRVNGNKLGLSVGKEEGARLGVSNGWPEGMML